MAQGCSGTPQSPPRRKLVLHFDLRNTLFVSDLNSRLSIEQGLNTYLAGLMWVLPDGSPAASGPRLRPPCPAAQTMYRVVEKQFVCSPEDRPRLRVHLGNFTETPAGAAFRGVFENHLALLRWPHQEVEGLVTHGHDGTAYHYLLPSFPRLLERLEAEGRDYAIILRTFGRDAPFILDALRTYLQGHHPDFPRPAPVSLQAEMERFQRGPNNELRYAFRDAVSGRERELTSDAEIYERWNSLSGIVPVQDDFVYWRQNGYHHTAAKPLWTNPSDRRVLHVMFDDNIRVGDEDTYLNLRLMDDNGSARDVPMSDFHRYDHLSFVQVDLLKNMREESYFIKKVATCEVNADAMVTEVNGIQEPFREELKSPPSALTS